MDHLPAEVQEAHRVLAEYYHEPVLPINEFCQRLGWYINALKEGREDQRPHFPASPFNQEITDFLIEHGHTIITFARKSNLLFRLLYLRQPLRTKKCPEHNGHWSGCHFFEVDHACQQGYDVTGWLPGA